MANVNYGQFDMLMNPEIKEALRTREHILGNNNAYPKNPIDPEKGNFEQQCAHKRFNDVIKKYQDATNTGNVPTQTFLKMLSESLIMHVFHATQMSCEYEKPHRKALEDLAVDIVRTDFNIREGDVIFNVKLKGLGNVPFPPEMKQDEEEMMEPPEITEANYMYDVDDEVQKRRLINSLISGASKKGHYIFHLGKPELDAINNKLIPLYQLIMSANDISYWMMGESFVQMAMESDDDVSHAGYEKITFNEDGIPVITVEAVNFPTLLHEIIKAVVELIATLALPDDKAMTNYIYDMADYVKAEMWYLRLGPVFWERLMDCIPVNHAAIKSQLLGKLFEAETDDFNDIMRSAISTDNQQKAKNFFDDWGNRIKENIRDYNQRNA